MTQKWYQKKAFLEQRKKWYAKLSKHGFQDSENVDWRDGESMELLNGHGNYSSQADVARAYTPEKEEYYSMVRQVYWDYLGKWSVEKSEAVQMYGDGISQADIVKRLGATRHFVTKWLGHVKRIVRARAKGNEDPEA